MRDSSEVAKDHGLDEQWRAHDHVRVHEHQGLPNQGSVSIRCLAPPIQPKSPVATFDGARARLELAARLVFWCSVGP